MDRVIAERKNWSLSPQIKRGASVMDIIDVDRIGGLRLSLESADDPTRRAFLDFDCLVRRAVRCGDLGTIFPLMHEERSANHGYGSLGRNNRLRRLGCRRDDHCGLALGLDDHGSISHSSRGAQPCWVGSGCRTR
jgi:hypothetical protein